jgi:hypothetical protein
MVEFMLQHNFPIDMWWSIAVAGETNNVKVLDVLCKHCKSLPQVYKRTHLKRQEVLPIIKNGHVDVYRLLLSYGFTFPDSVLSMAIRHHQVSIAEVIVSSQDQQLTSDNEQLWIEAIQRNTSRLIPTLQFLFEKKCPWNEDVIKKAIQIKSQEVVCFLVEHGYPFDRLYCIELSKKYSTPEMVQYFSHLQRPTHALSKKRKREEEEVKQETA